MAYIALTNREKTTITAEPKSVKATRSTSTHVTHFYYELGASVHVFKKNWAEVLRPYKDNKITRKNS